MLYSPVTAPLGHEGISLAESWTTPELPIVLGITLLTALYLYAVGPLRQRYNWAPPVDRRQIRSFLLAMLVAFVALQGPLHVLSDGYWLTAHMLQHLLVTLVMPALLLKGLPGWLVDRVLLAPLYVRRALRRRRPGGAMERLPRGPVLHRLGRFITSPFITFAVFNVIFMLWHVPRFYEATLTDDTVHSMMHMMFMGAAILTWWPIYSPSAQLPALNTPLQIVYLLIQSVPSTFLGAIITYAPEALYSTYAAAPRVLGLTAKSDQQIAGLLMWLGGAGWILGLLTVRWFKWMGANDEEADEMTPAWASSAGAQGAGIAIGTVPESQPAREG